MRDRLFTPRFFIMFGDTFTVFASVFQLLPTAPEGRRAEGLSYWGLATGRRLDAIGPRKVLLSCLFAPPVGLLLLALASGRVMFVVAAVIFGSGFGLIQPSFSSYVLAHVAPHRRGAAFDTGIGSGASLSGVVTRAFGYRAAIAGAAVLASSSMPYFVLAERRLGFVEASHPVRAA
jgi:MFS family permease